MTFKLRPEQPEGGAHRKVREKSLQAKVCTSEKSLRWKGVWHMPEPDRRPACLEFSKKKGRRAENKILQVDWERNALDITDFGKEFRGYSNWDEKPTMDFQQEVWQDRIFTFNRTYWFFCEYRFYTGKCRWESMGEAIKAY